MRRSARFAPDVGETRTPLLVCDASRKIEKYLVRQPLIALAASIRLLDHLRAISGLLVAATCRRAG
jgi:hypothetical protein